MKRIDLKDWRSAEKNYLKTCRSSSIHWLTLTVIDLYGPLTNWRRPSRLARCAVKARRPRLVLGWVTTREDRAPWILVSSSVWTWICGRPSIVPTSPRRDSNQTEQTAFYISYTAQRTYCSQRVATTELRHLNYQVELSVLSHCFACNL